MKLTNNTALIALLVSAPLAATAHNSVSMGGDVLLAILAYIILLPILIIANLVRYSRNTIQRNPNKAAVTTILSFVIAVACFYPIFSITMNDGELPGQLTTVLVIVGLLHLLLMYKSAQISRTNNNDTNDQQNPDGNEAQ